MPRVLNGLNKAQRLNGWNDWNVLGLSTPDVTTQKITIGAWHGCLIDRLFQCKKAMAKPFNDAYFVKLN
jgi:hypothetical protein